MRLYCFVLNLLLYLAGLMLFFASVDAFIYRRRYRPRYSSITRYQAIYHARNQHQPVSHCNAPESLPGQWPFMASLYIEMTPKLPPQPAAHHDDHHHQTGNLHLNKTYGFKCSAVIWSKDTILTAAHCVYHFKDHPSLLLVNLGLTNRTELKIGYRVKKIIIHGHYKNTTTWKYNDIALLQLTQSINFTSTTTTTSGHPVIAPVPRHLSSSSTLVNPKRCVILGWGLTRDGKLRKAAVSLDNCYPQCIKGRGRIGAKVGACVSGTNSGGALLCALADGPQSYGLVGMASTGPGSCNLAALPIFTYIPPYLDWIRFNSGEANSPKRANLTFTDDTVPSCDAPLDIGLILLLSSPILVIPGCVGGIFLVIYLYKKCQCTRKRHQSEYQKL